MDPIHVLVVERGADWSHWATLSQRLRGAAMILVQQANEPSFMFRRRIARKLKRLTQGVRSLSVLLGSPPSDPIGVRRRTSLLRELAAFAQNGLSVYSRPAFA
jgi:hypothetical protein